MTTLAGMVASDGPMKLGMRGVDVHAAQVALTQAGYRADVLLDGQFTLDTDYWVRQFQRQHGLNIDGVIGPKTAGLLDCDHCDLVAGAMPLIRPEVSGSPPHDDTASMLAYFGKPWENPALLERITPPWPMTYEGSPVRTFAFHAKARTPMLKALNDIWDAAGHNVNSPILRHVENFSGSYNYRPVRGSSRLSCHAFGAAIDFDAERLPLGADIPISEMPEIVVTCFNRYGFFWGGAYRGRKDTMHFQFAHE